MGSRVRLWARRIGTDRWCPRLIQVRTGPTVLSNLLHSCRRVQ